MSIQMPEKPKFSRGLLKYLTISAVILLLIPFIGGVYDSEIEAAFVLMAMFDGIPLAIYLFFYIPKVYRYNLAKTNFAQYAREEEERQKIAAERARQERIAEQARQERIEQERQFAIYSQQNTSPWAVKYSTHPCPHCGHYKVRCAKWEDKRASVAFWGIHSSKLAANYKCEHCGEMWE